MNRAKRPRAGGDALEDTETMTFHDYSFVNSGVWPLLAILVLLAGFLLLSIANLMGFRLIWDEPRDLTIPQWEEELAAHHAPEPPAPATSAPVTPSPATPAPPPTRSQPPPPQRQQRRPR